MNTARILSIQQEAPSPSWWAHKPEQGYPLYLLIRQIAHDLRPVDFNKTDYEVTHLYFPSEDDARCVSGVRFKTTLPDGSQGVTVMVKTSVRRLA